MKRGKGRQETNASATSGGEVLKKFFERRRPSWKDGKNELEKHQDELEKS